MNFLMIYIIPFLVVITVLVFVHELGHYWFARKYGVKVESFSIGMGPELFGFTDKNGTRWKFSAIPFGGYVMMYGDKDAASAPSEAEIKKMNSVELNQTLFGKTPIQRVIVSAAGPLANLAYAIFAFLLVYIFCGKPFPTNIVKKVEPKYPIAALDIRAGDIITRINDVQVTKALDITKETVKAEKNTKVEISRLRGSSLETFKVNIGERKVLGISFHLAYENLDILKAIYLAIIDPIIMFVMTILAFVKLFIGAMSFSNIGGPLSIANMLSDLAANGDIVYLFFFSAILGINLAALNLFPLPALDGGNIIFDLLEHFGYKVKTEYREKITGSFFILLMLFMVWATLNDCMKFEFVKNLFK